MDELVLEKKQAVNNIIAALSENITSEKVGLSSDNLNTICSALNSLFQNKCIRVIYTINSDNIPFGIYINYPDLDKYKDNILFDEEDKNNYAYEVEIDCKLFDLGFSPDEITELILHDVNIATSTTIITKLKNLIHVYALYNVEYIDIPAASLDKKAILTYGMKDTLYKLYSSLYGNYDNPESMFNLDTELQDKLSKTYYNNSSIFDNFPKVIILQWAFMIYKDIKHYGTIAKDTLIDAKKFTGSELIKKNIDLTLAALSRVDMTITESTSLLESRNYINKITSNIVLKEGSLFKSLKVNGLRSIENDYYEFAILVKSASDENEAMYALRGINTRISILSDYIYNTDISETEKKHWEQVIAMYQDLRLKLTKKNIINKKQYGLWFDYSQLDNLDKKENE